MSVRAKSPSICHGYKICSAGSGQGKYYRILVGLFGRLDIAVVPNRIIAAIKEERKLEMNALSERHKEEIAAIQDKLNTMIQEKERLKSAKSLAGPERAEVKAKATQA
jgi:hypothetical protein